MPIAWFIAPYRRILPWVGPPLAGRECAIHEAQSLIAADGGDWREVECLGDRAIVKVRASTATLAVIAARPQVKRLPKDRLNDPLSDLTQNQRNALRNELLDMGYTAQEIQSRFGNDLGQFTLRDVLRFAATRRRVPRYDPDTDEIVFDSGTAPCESVDDADGRVPENPIRVRSRGK